MEPLKTNDVETGIADRILTIRFTRPEIRNPLSVSVLVMLHEILDSCTSSGAIAAVIFTGTDRSFASGANLREIDVLDSKTAPAFAQRGQDLMSKIESLPQTTIAAINGYCFGGALDLALSCSRRIASSEAKLAHPGAGLGIITGWGGTQRLPRLIGQAAAMELFFTAEHINAEQAFAIGLVDEIAEDPVRQAREFVRLR